MAVLAKIFWEKMEGFDEEKTDPEKIGSNDNIIRKGKHCLIAGN